MTGMLASRLGLQDRSVIRMGAKADLVVSSPEHRTDPATYEDPHRYARGIDHVVVNGSLVIQGGEHTGNLPGRVLKPAAR